MQISGAGFNVGLLHAAFFAPRHDGIERLSHTTKISRRLFTGLLALQPPRQAHVIAKEKSAEATQRAVELLPFIGVGQPQTPRRIGSSLLDLSRRGRKRSKSKDAALHRASASIGINPPKSGGKPQVWVTLARSPSKNASPCIPRLQATTTSVTIESGRRLTMTILFATWAVIAALVVILLVVRRKRHT